MGDSSGCRRIGVPSKRCRVETSADMATGFLGIDDIVEIYCVRRGYAYRLASERRWTRERGADGRVRYARQDVDDALAAGVERRRARRSEQPAYVAGAYAGRRSASRGMELREVNLDDLSPS